MATVEAIVQLPPDGTGKALRAETGGNMPAGTYAEVLALQDTQGNLIDPAKDSTVAAVTTSLGTDGTTPPALPGGSTGVRGWLRLIWAALTGTLTVAFPAAQHVIVDSAAVTGHVTVDNPTANPETGLAKDATLSARWKASTGGPTLVSVTTADQPVYQPAAGKRPRLKWFYAATPDDGGAGCIVTVKIGATQIYQFPLGAPGVFAHGSIREGAADDHITVTLSAARQVYFNVDCEDF